MKKIKFISNRPWINPQSKNIPEPTIKTLPEWYLDADRFFKDDSGKYYVAEDGGKIPNWKACPAIYDIMGSGYVLKTPCDIHVYEENGIPKIKIDDEINRTFVQERPPMTQFVVPMGYYEHHFAWWLDWGVELPKGYSAIYLHPINRFELPFLSTSGIIDNDNVTLPGTMPFFIAKGFTGTIPAGTPYSQIIPFQRENWKSEIFFENPAVMGMKNFENSLKYRKPNGGIYQRDVWQRRKYE